MMTDTTQKPDKRPLTPKQIKKIKEERAELVKNGKIVRK